MNLARWILWVGFVASICTSSYALYWAHVAAAMATPRHNSVPSLEIADPASSSDRAFITPSSLTLFSEDSKATIELRVVERRPALVLRGNDGNLSAILTLAPNGGSALSLFGANNSPLARVAAIPGEGGIVQVNTPKQIPAAMLAVSDQTNGFIAARSEGGKLFTMLTSLGMITMYPDSKPVFFAGSDGNGRATCVLCAEDGEDRVTLHNAPGIGGKLHIFNKDKKECVTLGASPTGPSLQLRNYEGRDVLNFETDNFGNGAWRLPGGGAINDMK